MRRQIFENIIEPAFQLQWDAIVNHPFNQQLKNGSLNQKTYQCYIEQDLLYLNDYTRAFENVIRSVSGNAHHTTLLTRIKEGIIAYESEMRSSYLTAQNHHSFFLTMNQAKIPSVRDYTAHLLRETTDNTDTVNGLAAILPCFYIYFRLGQSMFPCDKSHPFYDWISTYYSTSFVDDTQQLISLFNTYCETCDDASIQQATETFMTSVAHEIAFMSELCGTSLQRTAILQTA